MKIVKADSKGRVTLGATAAGLTFQVLSNKDGSILQLHLCPTIKWVDLPEEYRARLAE